jgi:hypothetical protein
MDETATPQTLARWLYKVWAHIGPDWFEREGKDAATETQVRGEVRAWLDGGGSPPPRLNSLWQNSTEECKRAALLLAFPDGPYPSGDQADVRFVAGLMRGFAERLDDLFRLIDKPALAADEKAEAQALLRGLKQDLEDECKEGDRRDGALSPRERAYLYPALRKAKATIRVAWNSHPLKSNWHTELYSARLDIVHLLGQLEDQQAAKG